MSSHPTKPTGQPSTASSDRSEQSARQFKARRHRLINLAYALGLLLVFVLSLLLLPDDTGLGKLLRSELDAESSATL
ncbi:hypothetical protein NAV33_20890 [Pseudomonas stutzeri]|uniref:hypothetical protein n=1 Tax=Stutzerimonas stutzeri TaxID=316 RepID=UPI002108902E|nr:hypothetical protein [Stutzerimonas stutzeri]MCQ4314330.1 hypothetical protein [Stutzerimonas stutzeri]